MRSLSSVGVSCAVALSLGACGSGASEADLRPHAEALCSAWAADKLDGHYDQLSPKFQAEMDRTKWNELFASIDHAYGSCRKIEGARVVSNGVDTKIGRYAELESTLGLERGRLSFTLRFGRCDDRWCVVGFNMKVLDVSKTPDEGVLLGRSRELAEVALRGDGEALWVFFTPQLKAVSQKSDFITHATRLKALCSSPEIKAPEITEKRDEHTRNVLVSVTCAGHVVELRSRWQWALGAWVLVGYESRDLSDPPPEVPGEAAPAPKATP